MRYCIDIQCLQTASGKRGIGAYVSHLSISILKYQLNVEVVFIINSEIPFNKNEFLKELNEIKVQNYYRIIGYKEADANDFNVNNSVYHALIDLVDPDIYICSSPFEGYGTKVFVPTVDPLRRYKHIGIGYDLHPYVDTNSSFYTDDNYRDFYINRLINISRYDFHLFISESTKKEYEKYLQIDSDQYLVINGGFSLQHKEIPKNIRKKNNEYFLYVGGADARKNLKNLISAFSVSKSNVESSLIIVGDMPEAVKLELIKFIYDYHSNIINKVEFVGYVDDSTLASYYINANVVVLPAYHEGLGMSYIDAINFGNVVITSNQTSLREINLHEEAQFNPWDIVSISNIMDSSFYDEEFRSQNIHKNKVNLIKYSWETVSKKLSEFLLNSIKVKDINVTYDIKTNTSNTKKKILLIKLDHMGDFLITLSAFKECRRKYPDARIDIVVGDWNKELAKSLNLFDNIYCFNYFKSKSSISPSDKLECINYFAGLGYYDYAVDLRRQPDTRFALINSVSAVKIGYSTNSENLDKLLDIILENSSDESSIINKFNTINANKYVLRLADALPSEIDIDQFYDFSHGSIAIFPYAGNEIKEWGLNNFIELIKLLCRDKYWSISIFIPNDSSHHKLDELKFLKNVHLHIALNYKELVEVVKGCTYIIGNNSFAAHLSASLNKYFIGIYSGHECIEEWAPICNYAIFNKNTHCKPCHLASIEHCQFEKKCMKIEPVEVFHLLNTLRLNKSQVKGYYSFSQFEDLKSFSENFYRKNAHRLKFDADDKIFRIANALAEIWQNFQRKKNIFIDITEIVKNNQGTGIQRITTGFINAILAETETRQHQFSFIKLEHGIAIQIHAAVNNGNKLVFRNGEKVDVRPGDVYFQLDTNLSGVLQSKKLIHEWHQSGVKIISLVHDILPITHHSYFEPELSEAFLQWLNFITPISKIITVSNSTKNKIESWSAKNFDNSVKCYVCENGLTKNSMNSESEPLEFNLRKNILMVGTIEPRKGHLIVLEAFEYLLEQKIVDFKLHIVGKPGWRAEAIIKRINSSNFINEKIIWHKNLNDESLFKLYNTSRLFVAASIDEGFGLPIVEAASSGMKVIARDIPVFREIGDGVCYFVDMNDARKLADDIFKIYIDSTSPLCIKFPTIEESSRFMLKTLLECS